MLQKLLIIDDAVSVHKLVRIRLADEPYDIRSAYDAQGGAALVKSFCPDMILLDIGLPDEDGFAFCERLKSDPVTARIPVVFLTAMDSVEDKVHGLDLGAADFITKPFDAAELRARVRATMRTKALIDDLSRMRVTQFFREATGARA